MAKKILLNAALFILPLTFLIIGLNFHRTWFSGDPEYAYLLNGINIGTFHSVGHTDNPGTPTQMYSAVVLRAAHLLKFSEKSDLQTDVLQHPDEYVELERRISVILNALMMLLLGILSFRILRNPWFSLILQATPFISSNLLEAAFTKVSPEPMLIFTVMLLALVLMKYYRDFDKPSGAYPWIFSLISGFGLATKATFLPLAVLPLFLLKGIKNKLKYALGCIPAFVLFTAPAIPEYPHMAKWFLGLSSHTGTYGQGGEGIIDFSTYFTNLPAIATNNMAMSVSILAAVILAGVLLFRGKNKQNGKLIPFRFMSAIVIVQLLGILMVAKHYHANHYLIPDISLTGALWVFMILSIRDIPRPGLIKISPYLAPAVLIILLSFGISNRSYLKAANHGYIITNEEYTQVEKRLNTEFAGYAKAYYYPISINPCSALRWGSVYSKQLHLEALRTLYPDGLFYDIRINRFQLWETTLPAEDLISDWGGKILLVGGPMTDAEKKQLTDGGLAIREIYHGRTQAIYEVDTAASLIFKGINRKPVWTVNCSADSLSSDGKYFLAAEGFSFENNQNQSAEVSRTGKHSVKLPFKDSYAMAILLDSIRPGQQYRFSAWRKGGEGKAFLVAASEKQNEFYLQNCEYLKADKNGWKKVILEVTIPENYSSGTIKFYLWNSGDAPAWFDDFTLTRIL